MYQNQNRVSEIASPAPQPLPLTGHEAGITAGTVLLTGDGDMPVEFLSEGDRVITRDAGMARVRGVAHIRLSARAIAIRAGSLGDTRPEDDLILPAGQKLLIRDWRAPAMFNAVNALVPAGALVDGEFIRDLGLRQLDLVTLHFERPHIVYAGGLELAAPGTAESAVRAA